LTRWRSREEAAKKMRKAAAADAACAGDPEEEIGRGDAEDGDGHARSDAELFQAGVGVEDGVGPFGSPRAEQGFRGFALMAEDELASLT
jgi:hypothetical protein